MSIDRIPDSDPRDPGKPGAPAWPDANGIGKQPGKKKPKSRNLRDAVTLRPKDVFELYGIPTSSLCGYCEEKDEYKRLPSLKIPGRKGHKGSRLIDHDDLRVWLAKWKT